MIKKILAAFLLSAAVFLQVDAQPSQEDIFAAQAYFERAQDYSKNNQYSSAIVELKKALRLTPYETMIRIDLINNYLARAAYYNNKSKEYEKAMNDLRSALFFLKYYADGFSDVSAKDAAQTNSTNLDMLYKQQRIVSTPQNRFQIARALRAQGEFAASAYEFIQAGSADNLKVKSYNEIGDLCAIMGNQQQAVDYYKKSLTINPKDATVHFKLAKAYDSLGEVGLATTEYNYALANSNDRPLLLELEALWIKKTTLAPNDAEAHTNLGAVYQKMGDYTKALLEYNKSISLNPKNLTTRLNLGTLYQAQKNYTGAIDAYNTVLQFNPDDYNARYYKAQCLIELKQYQAAKEELDKLLAKNPDDKEVKEDIYELMQVMNSPEELLSRMAQEVRTNPQDAELTYKYAYQLHKMNRIDEAVNYYNQSLRFNPDNEDAYLNLAQAYKQGDDYENAKLVIQDGLKRFPDNAQMKAYSKSLTTEIVSIKSSQAGELYNQGKYQDALALYRANYMDTFEDNVNIASCYQALGDNQNALLYYKKAYVKNQNSAQASLYLGQTYVKLEDWANAKIYLTKALSVDPADKSARELLNYVNVQQSQKILEQALSLYSSGQYSSAIAILNNTIVQTPNNAYAYYYRGLTHDALKRYPQAAADYQKALSLDSSITEAYYSLAVDLDSLKQFKNAYINYQKYLSMVKEENEYTKYARARVKELSEYAK